MLQAGQRLKIVFFVLLQCFLLQSIVFANEFIKVDYRLWRSNLDVNGRYVSSSWSGDLDLKRDLGFGGSSASYIAGIVHLGDKDYLRWDTAKTSYDGAAVRKERISLLGGLISWEVTHKAQAKINMSCTKIGWLHYVDVQPKLSWGYLIDFKRLRSSGEGSITSTVPNSDPVIQTGRFSESVCAPVPGLALSWRPHSRLEIYSEITGIILPKKYTFYEQDVLAKWVVAPGTGISLSCGYRRFHFDNHAASTSSRIDKVTWAGNYFGLEMRF